MWNIKVYGRTILFCVHVSLCYQRWTHEPKEDVKKNIEWTFFPFTGKTPKRYFYVFIDFLSGGHKSFSNPTWPYLISLFHLPFFQCYPFHHSNSLFITLQKFIFPWIHFCCLFLLNFVRGWKEANERTTAETSFKVLEANIKIFFFFY